MPTTTQLPPIRLCVNRDYILWDGRHGAAGHNLYTLITSHCLPLNLPSPHLQPHPDRIFHQHLLRFHEVLRATPYTFLIPRQASFVDSIFDVLDYDQYDTLLDYYDEKGRVYWRVNSSIIASWTRLEKLLSNVLIHLTSRTGQTVHHDFRHFPFPSKAGYRDTHRNETAVLRALCNSYHLFYPLIAALTFHLACVQDIQDKHNAGLDEKSIHRMDWRSELYNKTGITPVWLTELEISVVGDRHVRRIGGILNAQDLPFPPSLLPLLACYNASIVLNWGHVKSQRDIQTTAPSLFAVLCDRHLIPVDELISALQQGPREVEQLNHESLPQAQPFRSLDCGGNLRPIAETATIFDGSMPRDIAAPHFPRLYQFSEQREGETWQQFFARRKARNAEKEKVDTPEAKALRNEREKNSMAFGRHGPAMFFWEMVDGYLIRSPVGVKNQREEFEKYGERQRVFDPFTNEWDLCEALAPGCEAPDPEWDDDEDFFGQQGGDSTHDDIPQSPSLDPSDDPSSHILDKATLTSLSSEAVTYHYGTPAFKHVLGLHFDNACERAYYRFGFMADPKAVEQSKEVALHLKDALFLLCAKASKIYAPPSVVNQQIQKFFKTLEEMENIELSCLGTLPAICDLQRPADLISQSHYRIEVRVFGGSTVYFLSPRDIRQPPMYVILYDASAVLDVIRHNIRAGFRELITHLVRRLMRFNTVVPLQKLPDGASRLRGVGVGPKSAGKVAGLVGNAGQADLDGDCGYGLGFRPYGYVPTSSDFAVYERRRERVFKSAKGRACVMAGGITARLALDQVDIEDVIAGPSSNWETDGVMCLWDGTSSTAYWDDCMSPGIAAVVCGVYQVDTQRGRCTPAERSFWPKPSAYNASQYNVGYYTSDCEDFFLRRSDELRVGTGEGLLKSAKEWKKAIRLNCQ